MTPRDLPTLALIVLFGSGNGIGLSAAAQTTSASTESAQTPTDLRLSLVGRWSGTLGYRDYQSDRLVEIPVTTSIDAVADGVTIVRRSLFDDGPDKPVWITTVSLDAPAAGSSTVASYRAGRAVEPVVETMLVAHVLDARHWAIVYRSVAADGNAPAEIRVTETLDGDTLTAIRHVRPVGAGEDAWAFRNQTQLSRITEKSKP